MDKVALKKWLATQPKHIKRLAKEFPPGYEFEIDEIRYYVIGYHDNDIEDEADVLVISRFNPALDYDNAVKDKKLICANHLRKGAKQDG